MSGIGYMDELVAKRAAIIARLSPAARAAHFPRLYPRLAVCKETRIIVNCRTGERTIEAVLPPVPPPRKPPHIRMIAGYPIELNKAMAAVCRAFDVSPDWLMAPGKSIKMADARCALFRLMWHMHHWPYTKTSKVTGRDHSGVRKALERAAQFYHSRPDWRARFDMALLEIKGRR